MTRRDRLPGRLQHRPDADGRNGCYGRLRETRWPWSSCRSRETQVGRGPCRREAPADHRLEQTFTARMSGLPRSSGPCCWSPRSTTTPPFPRSSMPALDHRRTGHGRRSGSAVTVRLVECTRPECRSGTAHALGDLPRASISQRHAVHAALADVLTGRPDRRPWHRAASTPRPDETIAVELEATARNMRRRGDLSSAVAALEHAARLSEIPLTGVNGWCEPPSTRLRWTERYRRAAAGRGKR